MLVSLIASTCLAPVLEPVWRTDGLDAPESVIADGTGGFIVSNVNGEGAEANGAGYLARLDAQGRRIGPERWVTGLNAPKGLALSGGRLFVADIDTLVEIDPERGEIVARYPIEGAGFLNDVAAHEGRVLVSDSARSRIHVLEDGEVSLWLEGAALAGVNGLLPEDDRLLVTAMSNGEVLAIDWQTRAVTPLTGGLQNADGIAPAAPGGYMLSQWPGDLWHWVEGEAPVHLVERRDPPVLMNDLTVHGELVIIPHWQPGAVSAWRLSCSDDSGLTEE